MSARLAIMATTFANIYMTRLLLSNSLRNTGFCRGQNLPLRNDHRRSLLLAKAGLHNGVRNDEIPQSSKLDSEAVSTASGLKQSNKSAESDAHSTQTTPKKRERKQTDKPLKPKMRGKASLRPGEVLPEVPAGDLPPLDMWRKYFLAEKASAHRSAVRNPETAALLADIFVPEGSKDKIIIEASPGPGQLTRALLRLPKERVKKIFVLEAAKSYLKYLEPLEQIDPRVKVYRQHGMNWEVYSKLKDDGAFDGVAQVDWDEVHPQLQFIMHMNSWVDGEQLLSQFFRCIPDRQWLFHYGRVPLNLILPTRMWERVNAVEGTAARCKLSVIAQATAHLEESIPQEVLKPYTEHFHPELVYSYSGSSSARASLEPRKTGTPHMAIRALPFKSQLIARGDLDVWDYVLRKLFVLKATSVNTCLKSNALGPGSQNLIPKLTAPSRDPHKTFDLTKKGPRDLNLHEWGILMEEFKNWPFRPEDLGIEAFFDIHYYNR